MFVDGTVSAAATQPTVTSYVDTDAGKRGIAAGMATAVLDKRNGAVQLGALPLRIGYSQSVTAAAVDAVEIHAEVLDPEQANELSPVGLAFRLVVSGEDGVQASAVGRPLQLTLDYSQIPLRYGGSFQDRLTLYRVRACDANRYSAEEAAGAVLDEEPCRQWDALPADNDTQNQQLLVDLSSVYQQTYAEEAIFPGEEAAIAAQDEALPEAVQAERIFLPLVSVDGMHQRRNNQPGPVGIGWSLESGYVTRHLKGCNVSQAPGDLCLVGGWNSTADAYSIVLNGVASLLVNVSGNLYRLQSDPYWKVEKFTNGATGHPDAQKEYWIVTTPDGTKYRFGGELMPTNEGGADQNSVFYTTIYNYQTAVCGSYSYDLCNKAWQWNLDRVEDTNGNVISYFYELEMNYYKARNYHTASNYYESSTTYDDHGRPTVVTDARSNSTTTAYHSTYGYVTSVTNDLSHVTSYVVDPGWGVQTKITDPNANVTELQYDGYGRLEKVWLPTEPKTGVASMEFVYDAAARPAWVKSRTLRTAGAYLDGWSYVDGFGRDLQKQAPLASGNRSLVSKKYNNLGQVAYQSAPYQASGAAGSGFSLITNWSTVANYHYMQYDELGNLWLDETKSTSSVLWSTVTAHDVWQKRVYDPRGNRTDYNQNGFGQLVTVTEYNTGSTSYTTNYAYDLQGNLTSVTDHNSNVTSMTYDLLGRKLTMSDPDMGSWQYQYDAVGNLIAQRDARNLWLHMEYDDLNRITKKRRDTAGTGTLVASYICDATTGKGKLHSSTSYDSSGSAQVTNYNMTYDPRGRVTYQAYMVSGIGSFRFDYTYNQDNQRKTVRYPGGNNWQQGETVTYGYNSVSQLTSVSGSGVSYVSAATYNAQGQMTQMVNENGNGANGLTREWAYETNTLRLSTIRVGTASPYTNRQNLTYAYDENGNVTSLTDSINSGQKQCFQYDYLNRLTAAFTGNSGCTAYSATGTGPYNHTYAYNAIGNITSYAGNSYTYGDSNHKHAITAAFGNSYSYDANGNQTSRTIGGTTYTFTYDYENRAQGAPATISGGTVSASFVYDADGNRVKSTVAGVTTVYLGGVYEYQGGATTKYYEGNALRRTGYGSDNGVFYLLRDHLNSSSVITSQAGTAMATSYYYPFGGNRGAAFSAITTKRFTGQYHESTLPGGEGLSYYNARWYVVKVRNRFS